ncbi:MAG: hypothetical protein N2035_04885 [Chthoniobacterales bacterium]|nr:hypothetical protein [Chthoniobacterales bacterium]
MEELKNIRSEHRQAVQKIKQDQTLTREQKKEKLSQLRQQMKKEFENVLTSEQIQKLNQMRQQWREKCKKNECPLTPSDPLSNGQSVNKPATN